MTPEQRKLLENLKWRALTYDRNDEAAAIQAALDEIDRLKLQLEDVYLQQRSDEEYRDWREGR